jgi:hypothetical protein
MDIDAAVRSYDDLIAEKQKEMDQLVDDIQQLVDERAALRAARDRLDAAPVERPSAADVAMWRKLGRSDAVLRIMHEHDGVMTNTAIVEGLKAKGRQGDTPNYVAATLQHLKKYEQVISRGRGRWSLTEMEVKSP